MHDDDPAPESHGGGLDAACQKWGGRREDWLDLSTGINRIPYPFQPVEASAWHALPDAAASIALEESARKLWIVPSDATFLAVPGLSAVIARLPELLPPGAKSVRIAQPTYSEYAASLAERGIFPASDSHHQIAVHPNNPDGTLWQGAPIKDALTIIDESFCDTMPEASRIALSAMKGVLVLKGLGKFWGLAGLRLGFVVGDADLIARLARLLGPWPVSGPALAIGQQALSDTNWIKETRIRLDRDAARLDDIMTRRGAQLAGGTSLFRLYEVDKALRWQENFAQGRILIRRFAWSDRHIRLGVPAPADFERIKATP